MNKINLKKFATGLVLIVGYIFILPWLSVNIFNLLNLDLTNNFIYLLLNLSVYLISLIILLIVYRKSIFKEFKDFIKNFFSFSKIGIKYWLQGLVFMLLTNTIIIYITGGMAANEEGNRSLISLYPIFSIISMSILGPFLEELLFRKGFKEAFEDKKQFLIVSSLLFGSAHLLASLTNFEWTQLLFIIPYAGFGYFFGKAYLETNNIYTSTFAHMLHNTLSVIIVLIGV